MIYEGNYAAKVVKGKLVNCPDEVTGSFWCDGRELTSLAGCTSSVGGHFYCYNNNLTSLAGCPSSVGGSFLCHGNKLTSLAGCPSSVGDNFWCDSNHLTSLADIGKQLKKCKQFNCTINNIKSNILGLLLIYGLTYVKGDGPAFEILNKWVGQGKSALFRCQKELIDNGHEEYAKL